MQLAGSVIDSVDEFKYLGSKIGMNDSSANEIRIRLAMARSKTCITRHYRTGLSAWN